MSSSAKIQHTPRRRAKRREDNHTSMDHPPSLDRSSYVRLTAVTLWENLPLVILAGCVFSLLGMPAFLLLFLGLPGMAMLAGVVMVGPAWAALLTQEAEIVAGKKSGMGTMFRALPRYAVRSMSLGALAAAPILAAFLTLPLLAQPEVPGFVWAGLVADGVGLGLVLALSLYAFPLLVLYDISVHAALRNAFILAGRYLLHTVGLLSMGVLFGLLTVYVHNGLALLLPAVWGIFVVNNCRLVVRLEEQAGARDGE